MPTILITNTDHELCDHGWLHNDRLSSIDYANFRIPEEQERKSISLEITLQHPEHFFNEGIQYLNKSLFTEAAAALYSAIQLRWNFPAAHIELGNAYSALKQYDRALEAYDNALENEPTSLITYYNIASTYTDMDQLDKALNSLNSLLKLNSKYQLAYTLLAKIFLSSNNPNRAISTLLYAARLSTPPQPDLLVEAGHLYQNLHQTPRATRCYQRALNSNPWHATAFYSLGLIQYNAGQLTAANLSLANAVNTQPIYPEAQALLKKVKKDLSPKKPRKPRKATQTNLFTPELAS